MSTEIKVPELPESVADAVIAGWHKQVGDAVRQDENLVDLETDKVILEVPAVTGGVIKEVRFNVGDTVTANQVIAVIDENASAATTEAANNNIAQPVDESENRDDEVAISPSARRLMEQHNIGPEKVHGSGKDGRVLKEDVLRLVEAPEKQPEQAEPEMVSKQAEPKTRLAPEPEARTEPEPEQPVTAKAPDTRIEKRVPMTRLRKRIAERLLEAQHNAAILTTFNEVNMKPVMDLRSKYKQQFEQEYGVKLGFMSFFVRASVEALKKFPDVNASIDGNDIVYHGYFDIGVAVSGPHGLVVPVLRNADKMSIAEIEKNILVLAEKAKDNKLAIEDITGGTFTISNGGVFGSMLSTPILNPPQSAILGMHNIKERAMVINGEIVALPMMYLALSYDHRIIDGREAVQFLVNIKDMLEDPSRMMLGV